MKKVKNVLIAVAIIGMVLYGANYLYNTDDPRIEVSSVYTVNSVEEDNFSATNKNEHHLNSIPFNLVVSEDDEVIKTGDKLKVTIFIDEIVSIKTVK